MVRRLIQDLYMRQEAMVRIELESDPIIIGKGVRQRCPIFPYLFTIYAEVMMIEAVGDSENADDEDIDIEDLKIE
jgi:hypothetical protein